MTTSVPFYPVVKISLKNELTGNGTPQQNKQQTKKVNQIQNRINKNIFITNINV